MFRCIKRQTLQQGTIIYVQGLNQSTATLRLIGSCCKGYLRELRRLPIHSVTAPNPNPNLSQNIPCAVNNWAAEDIPNVLEPPLAFAGPPMHTVGAELANPNPNP